MLPVSMCMHRTPRIVYVDPRRIVVVPSAPGDYDWAALWAVAHPDDGLGPWIEAIWEGVCRGCGERWEPGDLIRRSEFEDGYLCAFCGA